jgi:integrase
LRHDGADEEYTRRVLDGLAVRSRSEALQALGHFKRLAKPVRVFAVNTGTIDDYIAARRKESGKKKDTLLSPASLNKDLRHLKAALAKAVEWNYLGRPPRFHRQREHEKLVIYVTPEHFAMIYHACEDNARWPADQPYPPADWWRALMVTGAMTGWRIGQLLALRREDVDLAGGFIITRAKDNKGKRAQRIELHPLAVEHLKRLAGFSPVIFPWTHGLRIYSEFHALQKTGATQTERRSLVDWCVKFAKVGPWRAIRSKKCWCKLREVGGGELVLLVAIRHELFAQLKADRRLTEMGAKKFARRAARYGVGRADNGERPHGGRAIVLDQAFVADLAATLPDNGVGESEEICRSAKSSSSTNGACQLSESQNPP